MDLVVIIFICLHKGCRHILVSPQQKQKRISDGEVKSVIRNNRKVKLKLLEVELQFHFHA